MSCFHKVLLFGLLSACTNSNSSHPKIYGGEPAGSSYPFFVSIFGEGESYRCGGSLIETDVILTAAHCVDRQSGKLRVAIGHLTKTQEAATKIRTVKAIVIHEAFDQEMKNDVALLFLESQDGDESLASSVIALNRDRSLPIDQQVVRVIGYGDTESEESSDVSQLNQVDIPVISREVCRSLDAYYSDVSEGEFCGGDLVNGKVDSCPGDSGGPAFALGDRPLLTGIVSRGPQCGNKKSPGVYSQVAYYIPWIGKSIEEYRNFSAPISMQNIDEHIKSKCYGGLKRAKLLADGPLLLESVLTIQNASEWRASGTNMKGILAEKDLHEIERCEVRSTIGDTFSLVYAADKDEKIQTVKVFLDLNGRVYEAQKFLKNLHYRASCLQADGKLFKFYGFTYVIDGVIGKNSFSASSEHPIPQLTETHDFTCKSGAYSLSVFKSQHRDQGTIHLNFDKEDFPKLFYMKIDLVD